MRIMKSILGLIAGAGLTLTAHSQAYPSADYADEIPTLSEIIGHDHGDAITTSADIRTYLTALEAADPARVQVRSYGTSWQGQDLIYAIISSPENLANLDTHQINLATLGAGDGLTDTQIADTPAVVWLSYGVHGDEVTPSDSAIFMAYHLLAAENNELVDTILDNTLVIIDPNQNPDGRERFIHGFISGLGLEPQGDRYAVEHDQPWPRGRFNHYVFDLNRDWFALTQPETQGKVKALLDWHPVVFVDSHEMGGDQTYFFPPSADPFNPNVTSAQRSKQVQLGQNMARYFDRFGAPYFTREIFDAFYPGYGDMWPTLNGAVAMTFEQGSPRGLIFDRNDGTQLTYNEGVRNNVLSSLATLETVARNKDTYLRDYGTYRSTAISEATRASDRYVVMDLATARYEAETLARRLSAQGITVQRAAANTRLCGKPYPAGAIVVDLAQPQGRLIRTLLEPSTALPEDWIAGQENRRDRGLNHELYDVTAWSLPLMDGVEAEQCNRVDLSGASKVSEDDPIPSLTAQGGTWGALVPWTDGGQAQLVIAALRAGLRGKTTDEAFTRGGREYPAGSVIFAAADNPDTMNATLRDLATAIGAELVPMADSWVEEGPNFGSASFAAMKAPRVAMAWGGGTIATSAGNTRYVLERMLGLPVAPIRVSTLSRADLSNYDVLILPDTFGDLAGEIGSAAPIQEFVREGGVLIAFSRSVNMIAGEPYGLLSTQREFAAIEEGAESGAPDGDAGDARAPGTILQSETEYEAQIADPKSSPEDVPGVLVRAIANTDHWLASGYEAANVLVTGADIYRPLNTSDGVNVFRFAETESLLLSGYLWEENQAQLAYKPFVMAQSHGDGLVIGFTQSPTTRAYLNGLNLLVANAVVLAPARVAQ
ncbi:MAG: M14 family metallopeptidase [Pseudomonadota bacterium]